LFSLAKEKEPLLGQLMERVAAETAFKHHFQVGIAAALFKRKKKNYEA
jgi:hypothetical protein